MLRIKIGPIVEDYNGQRGGKNWAGAGVEHDQSICIKYFKKKKSRGGKNKQMGPIKKGSILS